MQASTEKKTALSRAPLGKTEDLKTTAGPVRRLGFFVRDPLVFPRRSSILALS